MNKSIVLAALLSAGGVANAQVYVWSNPAGGVWNDASSWQPSGVPNGVTHIAEIGAAGAYAVDMNINTALQELRVANTLAELRVLPGLTCNVVGGVCVNEGRIVINPGGAAGSTRLQFLSDAELSGGGTLVLNADPASLDSSHLSLVNQFRLTTGEDQTIEGRGRVRGSLTNNGVVRASTGTIEFIGSATVNNSLMEALAGNTLSLSGSTTQGPSGVLFTDGGQLRVGSVTGGRIRAIGGGVITALGGAWNGVASTGRVDLLPGRVLSFSGAGHAHEGRITVNTTGSGTSATGLLFNASGVVRGEGSGCEVVLNGDASNLDSASIQTGAGATVTIDPSVAVSGQGRISGAVTNNTVISVSGAGRTMEYASSAKTNNNVFLAENGATNAVRAAVTQGEAGRILADNATNRFGASSVTGGRIDAINGGSNVIEGATTWRSTTSSGTISYVPSAGELTLAGPVVRHDGDIVPDNWHLRFTGDVRLRPDAGTCRILLNHPNGGIAVATGGGTLTLEPGVEVIGRGRLTQVVNNSTITIPGPGGMIFDGFVNNGLVQARNSGSSMAGLVQGPDGEVRGDNSTLGFTGAFVTGGRVNALNGGKIGISSSMTWDVASSSGLMQVGSTSTLSLPSGLRHDGVVKLWYELIVTNLASVLHFPATATVRGVDSTCAIELVAKPGALDTARITSAPGAVVTLDATSSVTGRGRIYAAIDNQGVMSAVGAGNTLSYVGSEKRNNGLIVARDGAESEIGASISQGPAGEIRAENATTRFSSVAVTGGRITASNNGVILATGAPTFNVESSSGRIEIPSAAALLLGGPGHRHDGDIVVNPAASGLQPTMLRFDAPGELAGNAGVCRVVLNAHPADFETATLRANTGIVASVGPTAVVAGRGRVYGRVDLAGTIAPGDGGTAIGQIDVRSAMNFSASARLSVKLGGIAVGQFDRLTSNSSLSVDGTLKVSVVPGYEPQLGHFMAVASAGDLSGEFERLELPVLADPLRKLAVRYTPTEVVVFVTCTGNFNGDGEVDFFDYLDFVQAFGEESEAADINHDGQVDFFDYLAFVEAFNAGC